MGLHNFNPTQGKDDGSGLPPGIPIGPVGASGGSGADFDPDEFLINYNEKFKTKAPALFRDNVIQQTLACLIGKYKPNALLIGAAGVGKTAVAEDIARRIATDDPLIPDQLKGFTIYELPLANIVAGSSLVGEVERKTQDILDFAQDPANKIILFIDEIHVLMGDNQVYSKIAQIMKPALARGDMRVIGATTLQESQDLMGDPAFNRRFTRLIVDELSQDQTRVILHNLKLSLSQHYGMKVVVPDKVIDDVVTIADEHSTVGSHRPDNAITLLDRSMADACISRKVLEVKAKSDPTLMQMIQASPIVSLSRSQLKQTALKLATGNNEKGAVDYDVMRAKLSTIKGQDDALNHVLDVMERRDLDVGSVNEDDKKPLTLLFAGNSGVGKTEVAKIIARELTGTKPIILNMTEYHSPASINRIIGSPAGYVGSDSKTELPFDILESNPYQVILLDEFEKADRSVQRLFMSAFDEGFIKTSKGKIVDFSKSIMIATTNAGHTGKSNSMGFTSQETQSPAATVKDLSAYFDVELLNRFNHILNFNPITEDLFREIIEDMYRRKVEILKAKHPSYNVCLTDTLPDDVAKQLVKENYVKEFGARPAKKAVQKYIEDTILAYRKAIANAAPGTDPDQAEPDTGTEPDMPAESVPSTEN